MKRSIIGKIFKGERGNHENMPDSEVLSGHLNKSWELEGLLKKLLNDEQKAMLELYNKEQWEIEFEKEILAYAEGFKLGLLVGIECLEE